MGQQRAGFCSSWFPGTHRPILSTVWLAAFVACSLWALLVMRWTPIEASLAVGVDLGESPQWSWLWRSYSMALFGGTWSVTLGTIPTLVIPFAYERRAGARMVILIYSLANGASLLFERFFLHGTNPEWDYDIAPSNGTWGIWAALAVVSPKRVRVWLVGLLVASSLIDFFILSPIGLGTGTALSHSFGAIVGLGAATLTRQHERFADR